MDAQIEVLFQPSTSLILTSFLLESGGHLLHNPSIMSAATSTVTTATKKKNGTATLRMKSEASASKKQEETTAPTAGKETDFFWTYTEEPHRTRRMAIIKAHPEVALPSPPPSTTTY